MVDYNHTYIHVRIALSLPSVNEVVRSVSKKAQTTTIAEIGVRTH